MALARTVRSQCIALCDPELRTLDWSPWTEVTAFLPRHRGSQLRLITCARCAVILWWRGYQPDHVFRRVIRCVRATHLSVGKQASDLPKLEMKKRKSSRID